MSQVKPKPTRRFTRNYDPAPKNLSGIQCFYQSLVGWGIVVTIKGNELVIKGPGDKVSPVLEQAIEKRKDKLIAHIRGLK
jgi:DNA-binding transcriptional regulator YhcF (GntR family)